MAQWKPKTDKKAETVGKVAPEWLDRKDSSQYTAALGMALGAPEDQRNLASMLSRDSITGMVRQKRPEDLAEYLGLTEFSGFLIDTKLPLDARSEIRFTGLAFKGGNDKHHRLVAREYIGAYTLKPNLANLHDNVRAFLKGEDNWISELSLDRAMTGSTSIVKLDDAIKKSSLMPAEASRDEPEGAPQGLDQQAMSTLMGIFEEHEAFDALASYPQPQSMNEFGEVLMGLFGDSMTGRQVKSVIDVMRNACAGQDHLAHHVYAELMNRSLLPPSQMGSGDVAHLIQGLEDRVMGYVDARFNVRSNLRSDPLLIVSLKCSKSLTQ